MPFTQLRMPECMLIQIAYTPYSVRWVIRPWAVGNSSENIELPIEGELYSRGIILADINIDGTLNQKKVYESVNASTNDLQNVIGGHFGKRWQNCRSRVV